MLRAWMMLMIPCLPLLADLPELPKVVGQDLPARLELEAVPIASALEKSGRSELALLRAAAATGDLESQARLGIRYYLGQQPILKNVPWSKLPRPVYPLDEHTTWTPPATV